VPDDQSPTATAVAEPPTPEPTESLPMGTFTAEGEYQPRQIVENDLGTSLDDAYSATMVDVKDGQIVSGTVVRVDHDEVLLDIGYKSEGVIPSRELSIRNDIDPS
jgi:small subunit ribosomal protein S1